jgi:hypothetical protein
MSPPLVAVTLRHLAPEFDDLSALGHLNEDATYFEFLQSFYRSCAALAGFGGCCL